MNATISTTTIHTVSWVDRLAICISTSCLIHCLFLPMLLIVLPNLGASVIASETFHLWLVYAVIPSSLFALGMGCMQHKRGSFLLIGLSGLSFLILGASAESIDLSPIYEKLFTVIGALVIAFAHIRNFRACRQSQSCACDNSSAKN